MDGGRAAVVVPEGILSQTNSAYSSVRKKLLTECNLHTVISLPIGVFLPYSPVKTSVIFFDKTKTTKDVWFYDVQLLVDKKLTKKAGIADEHFAEILNLVKKREASERSWLVPIARIVGSGFNLAAANYNPHEQKEAQLRAPEEYALQIKDLLTQAMKSVDDLISELKM
jgi:type I restriction enzyme M protein